MTKYFLILLLLSCSSGVVKINSSPVGAQISVLKGDNEFTSIGVTPFEGERSGLFSSGSSTSMIIVSKEGFQSKEIVFTGPASVQNSDLNLTLAKATDSKSSSSSAPVDIERYSKLILKSSRLIHSKKFEEAQVVLDQLIINYPMTSAPYDLKANVYYLQHNYPKALENYQKSVSINPENRESSMMVEKVKTILK